MIEIGCNRCRHNLCAAKVPIFSFLSDNDLRKIISMTGHKTYKKGDVICREGETSQTLFILNEGQVKLSKVTKEGKEQIVHILSSGDFFGEMNLFGGSERYNFSAYAVSEVKICTLAKNAMDEILLANPEISLKLLKEVTRRLAETENLAQNLATNDAELRVAYMILEFGEKYGIKTSQGIEIKLPINREEMANYSGVARETISRKLNGLEEEGIVELKGNKILIIKDEKALRAFLE
ncbi:Crp/Fnr family transcriptional regulator [Clostridium polynesiense]|uniref:Crp/Fnr family transcriptional regulator n=1 Tax=Clostridium polynesiense TaxID=1325933 RepID=UPI0005912137|nr:Crp/Fnr family transcriptional regulator [Clostridium polynesiense]